MRLINGRALGAALLTALALAGSGCSDDKSTDATPVYSVPGSWNATLVNKASGSTNSRTIAFVGDATNGTFYLCEAGCSIHGTYVASGANVSFNFVFVGLTYTGTATFTGANALSGEYSTPTKPADATRFTATR